MTVDDSITIRLPNTPSVPDGTAYPASTAGLGEYFADVALFPFSLPQLYRRLTNPAEINAATDSVVTNDSPGFLSGFQRETARTVDSTVSGVKTVTGAAGGIVAGLLPWWLWALVGLALVAWIVTSLAPVLRRSP